jgi:hypothetical protein
MKVEIRLIETVKSTVRINGLLMKFSFKLETKMEESIKSQIQHG